MKICIAVVLWLVIHLVQRLIKKLSEPDRGTTFALDLLAQSVLGVIIGMALFELLKRSGALLALYPYVEDYL